MARLCDHLNRGTPQPASCVLCWFACYDEFRRGLWFQGRQAPPVPPGEPPAFPSGGKRVRVSVPVLGVCGHRGADEVEPGVYICNLDGEGADRCVPDESEDPAVWSCRDCLAHTSKVPA